MKSVHRAWDKLSRALSLPSRSTSHNTRAYTDFNIVSPPMEELLLVENDIVVGATGTFDGWNGNIQLSSKELLPSGSHQFPSIQPLIIASFRNSRHEKNNSISFEKQSVSSLYKSPGQGPISFMALQPPFSSARQYC